MELPKYEYEGKEYTKAELVELAKEKYGITIAKSTLDTRLKRNWPIERAISVPVEKRVKHSSKARSIRKLREAQTRYRKRSNKKDPAKFALYRTRSYARSFLRKFATADELAECQTRIENKIKELKQREA